ncbi:MAG: hypothetical protein A2275_13865 [Bacteroidetes bacterium RIFOXYA12_FULL_35_11]|nr:MAG: hypothetical protein A2X01_13220 [Bacteroidetes bacterium GWF2_35_48]OFY80397.1 MAG: hypothetical protein A2275_13865 [Bacteroidetes bacterium RIFOXYA12_FULL_35_11]OFZ05675.1 MAG: hypothetical protein A2491_20490 [Bacteroidetes bacterium RIFOXYC12_FULL_35_7]HBX50790.1 hypothetical protein [Bacteroidales bacterium]
MSSRSFDIIRAISLKGIKKINFFYISLFKKHKFPNQDKQILSEYYLSREIIFPDFLCQAPFNNMYFASDGNVSACCYNRSLNYGNIYEQSLSEIWNGKKRKQLAESILKYNLSDGCQACQNAIQEKSFSIVLARDHDYSPIFKDYPSSIEFELSNQCNLQCIMCNEQLSSKHADSLVQQINSNEKFLDELIPYLQKLKRAKFLGGEPFLIPIYYQIWQKLVQINPSCNIIIQTNGTILNDEIKTLLEKGKYHIGISLDSLNKDNYEKIRKGANFDKVMQNLHFFNSYCKLNNTVFSIACCPMQQNWKELPDIISFCNKYNIALLFNRVTQPKNASLMYLHSSELQKIYDDLSKHKFYGKSYCAYRNKIQYESLLEEIKSWQKKAKKKEERSHQLATLDIAVLEQMIIEELIANKEIDSEEKKERISNKIKFIINHFSKRNEYKTFLINIYLFSKEYLIRALLDRNETDILKKAEQIFYPD